MRYRKQLGCDLGLPWAENLTNVYNKVYLPRVKSVNTMQGLLDDK